MAEMPENDSRKDAPIKFSDLPEYISRKELAAFLSVSVSTLKRWGEENVGPQPVYLRPRAPRYEKATVAEYMAAVKRGPGKRSAPAPAAAPTAPVAAPVAAPAVVAPAPAVAPTVAPTVAPAAPEAARPPADAARPRVVDPVAADRRAAAPAVAPARPAGRVLTPAEREARDAVERAAADVRAAPVRPGGRMLSPEEKEARAAAHRDAAAARDDAAPAAAPARSGRIGSSTDRILADLRSKFER